MSPDCSAEMHGSGTNISISPAPASFDPRKIWEQPTSAKPARRRDLSAYLGRQVWYRRPEAIQFPHLVGLPTNVARELARVLTVSVENLRDEVDLGA